MCSPHPGQNGYIIKQTKNKRTDIDVGKGEPLYILGGNVKWFSHCGNQSRGF